VHKGAAEDEAGSRLLTGGGTASGGPRRYFCTYFDSRYLSRGLALYRSLLRHVGDFELWILCFDQLAYDALVALQLPNVRPVSLDEFERGDDELLAAKSTRSDVEYFFTCTPSWPLYVLAHNEYIDVLGYLDSDLFFFSSPDSVYEELETGSLLITAHDFPSDLKVKERFGRFNVGLMLFRHDEHALSALSWWRERCLEWCYDRAEDGRFADQKYLDQWPALFPETRVMCKPAGALAPWNWMNYEISWDRDQIVVNGERLVTYHFQSVSLHHGRVYTTILSSYCRMPGGLRRRLYRPYIRELAQTETLVGRTLPRRQRRAPDRARRTTLVPRQLADALRNGDMGVRIR
jgi:hypothetical protein